MGLVLRMENCTLVAVMTLPESRHFVYSVLEVIGWDSIVVIVTHCGLEGLVFELQWVQEMFSSPHLPRPALGLPSLASLSQNWARA